MLMDSNLSQIDPSGTVAQSKAIDSLLDYLLLRYFMHFFGICSIRARNDGLHYTAPVPTVVIDVDASNEFDRMLTVGVEMGCQGFIVTEQTVGAFFDAFLPVHDSAVQRSVPKRLIMVLQPNSSVFATIPQMLVMEELPEVLILLPTPSVAPARIELYTVDIFDGDPITIVTRLLDVVDNGGPHPCCDGCVDFFPDKFDDMNGRRLRLGTITYLPNCHIEDRPLGEGNARYILPPKPNVSAQISGTELWLVVLFCEIANCTTEIMLAPEWGTVFENGTKVGLIGAPAKRQVDIVLSGLYTWYSSYQYLAFSAVHSRSGCTCIVAKPRIVPNWRTPFQSFTGLLWCAVLGVFLTGAVVVLMVSRARQRILVLDPSARLTFSDSVLVMMGFFMEQTVPMPHELAASCLLFGTLMFGGFMIGSSYNGGLASTMIVPHYEKFVDNVHDLAETRTTWVGVTVSWVYSILFAAQPDMLTLLETFREWDEAEIARHAFDRDVAIIVERMEYGHFAHPQMDLEAMRGRQMLKDDVYWESVVGMCTKTWPGRARFDRMVMDLKAYGILAHWELIGVAKHLGLKSQRTIRFSRDSTGDEFMPLRMANVTGALLILAAGLSLATAVFVVERLFHRVARVVTVRLEGYFQTRETRFEVAQ